MNKAQIKNHVDDIVFFDEDDSIDDIEDDNLEESINMPLGGSPVYPRIFIGDSSKPLQNQFNESEYVDDNISRTWTGLLTSFYG